MCTSGGEWRRSIVLQTVPALFWGDFLLFLGAQSSTSSREDLGRSYLKKCNTACSLWAPRVRRRQPRCGVSVPPTRLLLPGPHRCSEKLRVLPSSHMAWSFICGAKLKCALLVSILPADSDPAFGSTCRRVGRMPGPCNCTAWRAGHIAVPNDAHYLAATAAGGCGSRSRREIM